MPKECRRCQEYLLDNVAIRLDPDIPDLVQCRLDLCKDGGRAHENRQNADHCRNGIVLLQTEILNGLSGYIGALGPDHDSDLSEQLFFDLGLVENQADGLHHNQQNRRQ